MKRQIRRYQVWLAYVAFVIVAALYGAREPLFAPAANLAAGKWALLVVYIAFLAFSLYATSRENALRSFGGMMRLLWGRQLAADLYISMAVSLGLIWLVEGSLAVMLLWSLPVLCFANLALLPYLLLNYSAVVGPFLP